MRSRVLPACLLFLGAALSGITKPASPKPAPVPLPPPPPAGPIYTVEGTFPLLAKKEPFLVAFKDQHLSVTRSSAPGGVTLAALPGWVLFDDGETTLWFYPGRPEIQRVTLAPGSGVQVKLIHPNSSDWPKAPPPLLEAIKASQEAALRAPPPVPPPPAPPAPVPAPKKK